MPLSKTSLSILFVCVAWGTFAAPAPATKPAEDRAQKPLQNPFNSAEPYRSCVLAIDSDPQNAFDLALSWRDLGGGVQAERCAALALIALDEPGEAASRLDALARRPAAGTLSERAAILGQSGNAWLLAGQAENAEAAFSAALKLTPRDPETWIDRARARAVLQNWTDAEADLTAALSFDNTKPETYVLRAAARQKRGNKTGYRSDIAEALMIDPNSVEALVERGTIRAEDGDLRGARADWLQVLLKDPDGPAGDAARSRIQALEVHDPLRR